MSTLEHVDFELAPPVQRILAGVIDIIIAYIIGFIMMFGAILEWEMFEGPFFANLATQTADPTLKAFFQMLGGPAAQNIPLLIFFIEFGALILAPVVYFVVTTLTEGQSIGMMLFRLHVRRLEDNSSTKRAWKTHLVRSLLYVVEVMILFPLPIILIFVTENKQRIGDMLTKTTVMKVQEEAAVKGL